MYYFISTISGGEGPAIKKIPNVDGIKDPKDVSDQEWKNVLSPEAYDVTRQGGTEPAFTGKYDKHFKPGRLVSCDILCQPKTYIVTKLPYVTTYSVVQIYFDFKLYESFTMIHN